MAPHEEVLEEVLGVLLSIGFTDEGDDALRLPTVDVDKLCMLAVLQEEGDIRGLQWI